MELVDDPGNSTTTIPVDLIVEILSRLPAKSIIRFQSVSKEWFSIIRSKDLANTFLTRSKTRPHLFLVHQFSTPRKYRFFSVPEHNMINDITSTGIARQNMNHSEGVYYYYNSLPVNGFVCFTGIVSSTGALDSITVWNPITRQTVKLPDIRSNGRGVYALLGYDPVEDQYKVLCLMTYPHEYYVCTVSSSEKQEWRKIENVTVDEYPCDYQGMCIDGGIYYKVRQSNIVRFDVRSEKMELIKAPQVSKTSTIFYLVNYNGRLGGVESGSYTKEMKLWVLEDVEKKEWSSVAFICEWKGFVFESKGVIHTGELMAFERSLKGVKLFSVYYYDFNKKSSRTVEIQGVETDEEHGRMFCYPGYFENIRFL